MIPPKFKFQLVKLDIHYKATNDPPVSPGDKEGVTGSSSSAAPITIPGIPMPTALP